MAWSNPDTIPHNWHNRIHVKFEMRKNHIGPAGVVQIGRKGKKYKFRKLIGISLYQEKELRF
jgi:hypothetical protein